MDIWEINNELEALEAAMVEKDVVRPSAQAGHRWLGEEFVVWVEAPAEGPQASIWESFGLLEFDSLENCFAAAFDFVENLKDKATRERESFMASMGALIDQGRAAGIEVEFMNPLTEMMKQLSENALEDHS